MTLAVLRVKFANLPQICELSLTFRVTLNTSPWTWLVELAKTLLAYMSKTSPCQILCIWTMHLFSIPISSFCCLHNVNCNATQEKLSLIYEGGFIFLVINIAVDFPCPQREHTDLQRGDSAISTHTEQCFTHSFSFGPVAELCWEDKLVWPLRKTYFKGVSKFKVLFYILVSQLGKCNVIPKHLRLFKTGIWIWNVYENTIQNITW